MKKKILIVDDSESIRVLIVFILEEAGYEVLVGNDGIDAQNHLNGQHLDLIITDLHMPNMDGIGLIKVVRNMEAYKSVPILFLTTESQTERKMQAKAAGATGWIVKPFEHEKFLAACKKVIEK